MKKLILASASAIALLGVAACSDNTDATTTQSTTPPAAEAPMDSTPPAATPAPSTDDGAATDDTTTQSIEPEGDAVDGDNDAMGATPDEQAPANRSAAPEAEGTPQAQ